MQKNSLLISAVVMAMCVVLGRCNHVRAHTPASASFRIWTSFHNGERSGGTAVGIHPRIVATNSHVVGHRLADDLQVVSNDGHQWAAHVIAFDRPADVALCYVQSGEVPYVQMSDIPPDVGEVLTMIGYGGSGRAKLGRGQLMSDTGRNGSVEVFAVGIRSVSGDSGAGLFLRGRLVGLNWGADARGASASTPVRHVRRLLETWAGRHSYDLTDSCSQCTPRLDYPPKKQIIAPPADVPPSTIRGPVGPIGPQGRPGEITTDQLSAIVAQVVAALPPPKGHTVEVYDRDGKLIDSEYVSPGGTFRIRKFTRGE